MTTPSFEVVRTSPPSRRVCVLILIWISIEYGKVAKCILSWVSNKGSSAVSLTLPTAVDQILDISLLMHDFNATLTTKTNNQIAKCIWHQKFNRLCQGSNLYLWTVEPGQGVISQVPQLPEASGLGNLTRWSFQPKHQVYSPISVPVVVLAWRWWEEMHKFLLISSKWYITCIR